MTSSSARLQSAIADYLVHLRVERGLSPATLRAYGSDLTAFSADPAVARGWDQSVEPAIRYLSRSAAEIGRAGRPLRSTSLRRRAASIRGFYRFAYGDELIATDIAARIDLPRQTRLLPDPLDIDSTIRLLEAAGGGAPGPGSEAGDEPAAAEAPARLRDRALLELLYAAGLRISEALNLEPQDVDLSERLLCIRQSKFFKTRWVPIGPKLTLVLRAQERQQPAAARSHPRFFLTNRGTPISRSTSERIFAKLRSAAGVQRTDGGRFQPRLHDLRHSAAVHRLVAWYHAEADVQSLLIKLSAYLGHVDLAATQKYLTWTPELRTQAKERFARYALGGAHE